MQILAGIILLGVLIAFHELGHFLFAKMLGVRVLVFSIGFGPKIWGIKRGETEYRISAIPLGGYVRMFGESLEEEYTDEQKRISFMHQPIWRKSLIALAGPLFNFILPVILFFFLLLGAESVLTPRVGTLIEDGAAARAGILPDDVVIAVNDRPVESFNEVADIVAKNPNVALRFRIKRATSDGPRELDLVLTPEAKASSNPLEKNQSIGRVGIMPARQLPIIMVSDESPLYSQGLRSFDTVKKIDGHDIESAEALERAIKTLNATSTITVMRKVDDKEQEIAITLTNMPEAPTARLPLRLVHNVRDEDMLKVGEKIASATKILLREQGAWAARFGTGTGNGAIDVLEEGSIADKLGLKIKDRIVAVDGEKMASSLQLSNAVMNDPRTMHVLGVLTSDGEPVIAVFSLPDAAVEKINFNTDFLQLFGASTVNAFSGGELITRQVGVFEALRRSFMQTVDIAWMTGKSLVLMVTGDVPATQIGGPIMLFDVAKQAAEKGIAYYVSIMCFLSVNLGLLNLLPIPALDGGHLLLFGIEAVQRRPLTPRTRTIATQIGITILLMVMAFAIFNDVRRLFS